METKETLILLTARYEENRLNSSPNCFLSVINHDNDETIVSKIVAYLFAKVPYLAKRVIKQYYCTIGEDWLEQELILEESIECEKVITDRKRIDVFITLRSSDNERYCILIENKVRSSENGGQTKNYEAWLERNREGYKRIYIYLKPSWNQSKPKSKKFAILTFNELSEMIENANDYIVIDFKRYVEMKEINTQLTELENILLCNYDNIANLKASLDSKINNFKKTAMEQVAQELGLSYYDDKGQAFHFYDKQWWQSKPLYYYFYVEYKFNTGDMTNIVFQKIIGKKKTKTTIMDFVQEKGINVIKNDADQYLILESVYFVCKEPVLSQAWISAFIEQAVEVLTRYKKEMSTLFIEFTSWLEKR